MVLFKYILILAVFGSAKSSNNGAESNSSIVVKSYTNISSIVPGNISRDGKTYFFKYNTNNNQFRIYNRVTVNVEDTKNATKPPVKQKFNPQLDRSNMNELRKFEAFLDEEWNYSISRKIPTTELPVQIYPFLYKEVVDKTTRKRESSEPFTDITKILFNDKKNNSLLLNFKLGKIEENYSIENAELHFYWTVSEDSEFYKNSCVLRLYEVDDRGINDTTVINSPDTHKLLNVIYASKAQTGWQMFRISKKSINSWMKMMENLRLLISISKANQVNSTTMFNDTANNAKWRTFLILKIRDEGVESENIEFPPDTNSSSHNMNIYCNRINYYIDFRKLHWSNFIIAPEGFMAYDCNGKCTRHNTESFSNHLRMLTTFQNVDTKFRTPCCVPIHFYSLPIMFYDKLGNIVIKVYRDMITARCGCR